MSERLAIKRIAIVGGGTAGWMTAAILARALPGTGCEITVIESAEVGTVGVGEATIPPILDLLRLLNINEGDFVRHTAATYKLGIKFTDWSTLGASYWHPFGSFGTMVNLRPFTHCWHRARADGAELRFNDFSLCAALGDQGKFRFPDPTAAGPVAGLRYALHFDATLVAKYLRAYAERLGVTRLERHVIDATRLADGRLGELVFADHGRHGADLFIDCSGFRGILIEKTLQTGYTDWSSVLPCDRAVAFPTELVGARPPFTQAFARAAGWRWRIPLQHRVGNGYVYSSSYIEDSAALADLVAETRLEPRAEPRLLRFVTGRRKLFWNRNCVALGLASGFIEPLESTSIHLVMSGVYKLLEHFPDLGFAQANIDSYNRELSDELERIRDFIVLHYCASARDDSEFWRYCRHMRLPDTLQARIDLYRSTGRIRLKAGDLFNDLSWFYVFEGMGIRPMAHDPLVDVPQAAQLQEIFAALTAATAAAVKDAPAHDSYFSAPGGERSASRIARA